MMITEAIARADSAATVYSLLTAYFEAVQSLDGRTALPDCIVRLPIRGELDLDARHIEARVLHSRCIGETGLAVPLLGEVIDVCEAGLDRLHALDATAQCAA